MSKARAVAENLGISLQPTQVGSVPSPPPRGNTGQPCEASETNTYACDPDIPQEIDLNRRRRAASGIKRKFEKRYGIQEDYETLTDAELNTTLDREMDRANPGGRSVTDNNPDSQINKLWAERDRRRKVGVPVKHEPTHANNAVNIPWDTPPARPRHDFSVWPNQRETEKEAAWADREKVRDRQRQAQLDMAFPQRQAEINRIEQIRKTRAAIDARTEKVRADTRSAVDARIAANRERDAAQALKDAELVKKSIQARRENQRKIELRKRLEQPSIRPKLPSDDQSQLDFWWHPEKQKHVGKDEYKRYIKSKKDAANAAAVINRQESPQKSDDSEAGFWANVKGVAGLSGKTTLPAVRDIQRGLRRTKYKDMKVTPIGSGMRTMVQIQDAADTGRIELYMQKQMKGILFSFVGFNVQGKKYFEDAVHAIVKSAPEDWKFGVDPHYRVKVAKTDVDQKQKLGMQMAYSSLLNIAQQYPGKWADQQLSRKMANDRRQKDPEPSHGGSEKYGNRADDSGNPGDFELSVVPYDKELALKNLKRANDAENVDGDFDWDAEVFKTKDDNWREEQDARETEASFDPNDVRSHAANTWQGDLQGDIDTDIETGFDPASQSGLVGQNPLPSQSIGPEDTLSKARFQGQAGYSQPGDADYEEPSIFDGDEDEAEPMIHTPTERPITRKWQAIAAKYGLTISDVRAAVYDFDSPAEWEKAIKTMQGINALKGKPPTTYDTETNTSTRTTQPDEVPQSGDDRALFKASMHKTQARSLLNTSSPGVQWLISKFTKAGLGLSVPVGGAKQPKGEGKKRPSVGVKAGQVGVNNANVRVLLHRVAQKGKTPSITAHFVWANPQNYAKALQAIGSGEVTFPNDGTTKPHPVKHKNNFETMIHQLVKSGENAGEVIVYLKAMQKFLLPILEMPNSAGKGVLNRYLREYKIISKNKPAHESKAQSFLQSYVNEQGWYREHVGVATEIQNWIMRNLGGYQVACGDIHDRFDEAHGAEAVDKGIEILRQNAAMYPMTGTETLGRNCIYMINMTRMSSAQL